MLYLSSVGFGLILIGSMVSDMIQLRTFMLIGNIFLLLWAILELNTDKLTTIIWQVAFVSFNLFHLIRLLLRRRKEVYTIVA